MARAVSMTAAESLLSCATAYHCTLPASCLPALVELTNPLVRAYAVAAQGYAPWATDAISALKAVGLAPGSGEWHAGEAAEASCTTATAWSSTDRQC